MNIRTCLFTALMALGMVCANATAQDNADGKPITRRVCVAADLKGTYVLVDFKQVPPGPELDGYKQFPYQYLTFYPTQTFNWLSQARAIESAEKLQLKQQQIIRKNGNRKYILRSEGELDFYSPGAVRSYRCVINTAAADEYQKGDIILTGYGKDDKKSQVYKLFRHWY